MEALKKKLNSSRGASILLALLFMLVCILVGASVVMAASSNAGKIKSNKEEQQKYLTLSSAVNLLVDELESVEYVGQYMYSSAVTHSPDPTPTPDPENPDAPVEPVVEITTHTYALQRGKLRHQSSTASPVPSPAPTPSPTLSKDDWGSGQLEKLLPLNNDLDAIFKKAFDEKYKTYEVKNDSTHETRYVYTTLPDSPTFNGKYPLKFTVNDSGYGDLSKQRVEIDVELKEDGRIFLTATLWEKKTDGGSFQPTEYSMEAMLRTRSGDWPAKEVVLKSDTTTFAPVRWELEYIYKGKEESPVATPTPTPTTE